MHCETMFQGRGVGNPRFRLSEDGLMRKVIRVTMRWHRERGVRVAAYLPLAMKLSWTLWSTRSSRSGVDVVGR